MQSDVNDLPRIFGDFNSRNREGCVRLTTVGTYADLRRLNLQLVDGLEILVDDHDEFCERAIVRWSAEGEWVAELLDPKWKRFDATGHWDLECR